MYAYTDSAVGPLWFVDTCTFLLLIYSSSSFLLLLASGDHFELSAQEKGLTVEPEFKLRSIKTTDPHVPVPINAQPRTKKMALQIILIHQKVVRGARQLSHIHM
jgi:hypothetical protein